MDAKKCDRCGLFYIRKDLKMDNAVDIFGKKVFNVFLRYFWKKEADILCKTLHQMKW